MWANTPGWSESRRGWWASTLGTWVNMLGWWANMLEMWVNTPGSLDCKLGLSASRPG